MIEAHQAYEKGHTPVTLGRAPWLPALYLDGIAVVRAAVAECELARMKVAQRKAAARRG